MLKVLAMFVSFFPRPRLFFLSVLLWSAILVAVWFLGGENWGGAIGLPPAVPDAPPIIGVPLFWSAPFLWFYLYFAAGVFIFYAVWARLAPHRWALWSILGSALILFTVYFQVEISVAVNAWYGPFYDLVQNVLDKKQAASPEQLYGQLLIFVWLALVGMNVSVLNAFFVSHWIFRWRMAMNDYYMEHWALLRHIEGAAQRVQEDTMRFSQIMEDLGVSFVQAVMTLIAFMPVLVGFEKHIVGLPVVGAIAHPLVLASLAWSVFGTVCLVVAGFKLPGLQFRNQRVEAAYRKELVYGEDDAARATPPAVGDLFDNVRRNYFRLYFHYVYFNVVRYTYLQANNAVAMFLMIPSIAAVSVTFGLINQIDYAFSQVSSSFQYLVTSWSTIVELMSVQKRLRAFEAAIHGERLPAIDERYLERRSEGDALPPG